MLKKETDHQVDQFVLIDLLVLLLLLITFKN
jgi:hypothetical protein